MAATRTAPDTHTARYTLIVCTWEQQARAFGDLLTPIQSPYSPISWDDVRPEARAWAGAHGVETDRPDATYGDLEVWVGDTQGHVLGTIPFPYLAVEVTGIPYADRMTYQIEVAAPPAEDGLIPGGIDHGDHVIWQAVDWPVSVTQVSFRGTPRKIAEAVADSYANDQAFTGAVPGSRVRAVVADLDGQEIATSGIYEVGDD